MGALGSVDLASQRLGDALDLFGRNAQAGQVVEQFGGIGEAGAVRRRADHTRGGWRARAALQPQGPVARTEARLAGRAVVVGAVQFERAERGDERLGTAAGVTGRLAAGAGQTGALPVGAGGVEPVLDGQRRKLQGAAPRGGLEGLQIQLSGRAAAQQRLDLSLDGGGGRAAESFLPVAVLSSAKRASHTSISSLVKRRKRWHSST